MGEKLAAAAVIAGFAWAQSAAATDYCVDAATGSDAASGRCSDRAWATLGPASSATFAAGDRILIAEGRYVHPLTAWYMTPGVSWIGAGREATTVVFDKVGARVAFVRFTTGTAGSGRPGDLRPAPFEATTVLSDLTVINEGDATTGIDVVTTSGDSAPTLARLGIRGFATGVRLRPASDERVAASTHAAITQNVIDDTTDAAIVSLADVFYARAVTEASTLTNCVARSSGAGARIATSLQDLRDAGQAIAAPVLTNDTIASGTESAVLLVSYYDDGTGSRRTTAPAGSLAATLANSIFTGSARHGIEEWSPSAEPASVTRNGLGGNALGDYRDEGLTVVGAASVGTGNIGALPSFVDAASGDLHVMAGSPTIDLVPAAAAPPDDVDGPVRPQGAAADAGADELVPCSALADASATVQAPPCAGSASRLDASRSTIDAACAAGPAFEWYDGATKVGDGSTLDVAPAAPTTYRLVVRCADAALSACRDETTILVAPSPAPPTAGAGPDVRACAAEGRSVAFRLEGAAAAAPPASVARVAWTATEGSFDDPSALGATLTIAAGAASKSVTATLEVTDDRGCRATDDVVLTVDPAPVPVILPAAAACHAAGATEVVVDLESTTTGGTPPFAHAWTSSAGTVGGTDRATLTVPTTGVTQFVDVEVTVTDQRGCQGASTTTVQVGPAPVARAGDDTSTCHDQGTAAIPLDGSASSGEAPLDVLWTTTAGTIRDPAALATFLDVPVGASPLTANVMLEISTGAGACASRDERAVTVGTGPSADAGADLEDCVPSGLVAIALDGTATGGTPPLDVLWTTTAGRVVDPGALRTSLEVDVGARTADVVVTLEVADQEGACLASDERRLVLHPGSVAVTDGPWSAVAPGGGPTLVPLDGSRSAGEAPLSFAWTTTLGTFVDTGTNASALAAPTLSVPEAPVVQRGEACLTVTSSVACAGEEACARVAVLLEPLLPPNDVSPTLRVAKRPPDDVALAWQDAPVDAGHDEATAYDVLASGRPCGPFARLLEVPRMPGMHEAVEPVLASLPRFRCWFVRSVNDGGASLPGPPDGTLCP